MGRVVTWVVVAVSAVVGLAVQVVWVVRVEMRAAWVVMGVVPVGMEEALVAWVVWVALVGLAGTHTCPPVWAALVGLAVMAWMAAASPCRGQQVLAPARVVAAGAAAVPAAWVGLEAEVEALVVLAAQVGVPVARVAGLEVLAAVVAQAGVAG